jgi:hypothetical protein
MTNTRGVSNSQGTGVDLIRLGGLAAVLAGVAWAVSGIFHFILVYPEAGTGPTGSLSDYLIEGAHAVAEGGMLVALLGLRARQAPAYGRRALRWPFSGRRSCARSPGSGSSPGMRSGRPSSARSSYWEYWAGSWASRCWA